MEPNTCAPALLLDNNLLPGTKVVGPRSSSSLFHWTLGLTEPDPERTAPVLKPVPARKCYLLLKDKGVSYSVMSDSFDPMD